MTGDELTIGEVIGRLAADFPDLTVSKIRYLESGVLISPQRTPSGYRRFTEDDIEKLRWVLSAQRDQFLPLKVIRQHLASGQKPQGIVAAALAGGASGAVGVIDALFETAVAPGSGGAGGMRNGALATESEFFAEAGSSAGELHMSRDGLARTAGVDPSFISDLIAYGLLPASDSYGGDAVLVTRAAASVTAHGLEPRHLRPLLTGARNTAGLISTLLVTRRADGVTAGERQRSSGGSPAGRTADVAAAAVRLYAALLRAELAPAPPGPAQN
jgi:DNA-binding transcriptional MerR regulator